MQTYSTLRHVPICLIAAIAIYVSPGIAADSGQHAVDKVTHWNSIAIDCAKIDHRIAGPDDPAGSVGEQFGPTRTGRALAIVHIAIFDAVNAIDRSYKSYLPTSAPPPNTSMEAAIAQSAHDTIVVLWPHQANSVDQELQAQLAEIPMVVPRLTACARYEGGKRHLDSASE